MAVNSIRTRSTRVPLAALPQDLIWRLSVEQYHEMMQAGILTEDDPVELLEGWLVYKMTKNPPHTVATQLLQRAVEQLTPEGWLVRVQEPITLDDSEPEPDVTVVRGKVRDYVRRHPSGNDVALVIEIANATLQRDRDLKKRIYARAGIPIYWIVNLIEKQVEVYSDPAGASTEPNYGRRQLFRLNGTVPMIIGKTEVGKISVEEIMP